MFYSQFILAKKGPLGTIWIAAHLERKLRKNQVADTDIGVSVDSILFPEVPIALRLSSHLLLGVVRIYSRKVNYLFDDCSEALLKIKQAFRSTAVDLPPEESTAPYHSITLPETFDLDDFELPDNDLFQGNYVDHHISTREQITLQDTMEGVVYSTSQFGLDERFGDGDTSQVGLDLEEDLFLDRAAAPVYGEVSEADPQASFKSVDHPETDTSCDMMTGSLNAMPVNGTTNKIEDLPENSEFIDYAQAPATPGLVEEPNLFSVQKGLACDDHLESEDHIVTELIGIESAENASSKSDHHRDDAVDLSSGNHLNHDTFVCMPAEENGCLSGDLEINQSMVPGDLPSTAVTMEHMSADRTVGILDSLDKVDDMNNGSACNDESSMPSTDRINGRCKESIGVRLPEIDDIEIANNMEESHLHGKAIVASNVVCPSELPDALDQVNVEAQAGQGLEDPESINYHVENEHTSGCVGVLRACNSCPSQPDTSSRVVDNNLRLPELQSEDAAPSPSEASRREKEIQASGTSAKVQGEECHLSDGIQSEENQILEPTLHEEIQADGGKLDEKLDKAFANDNQFENLNSSLTSNLPAPEKLLSVQQTLLDKPDDLLVEATPDKELLEGVDGSDAGTTFSGKNRTLTESSLTMQSLNSVESFGVTKSKRTRDSIPDDDDLLSSILVGRRSSVLKMKPTPPASEVASMKRSRSASRPSTLKRKVLMDDSMVLLGDTIRQQLTNTEDIRRLRKKAPCTRTEILMIQRQFMEDGIFSEPILTGMASELTCLHSETFDLSRIRISENDDNNCSSEAKDKECSTRTIVAPDGEMEGSIEPVICRNNIDVQSADFGMQRDNQHGEDHYLGSYDVGNQERMDAIAEVADHRTSEHEPLGEIVEMEIDRGNAEVSDAANPSVILGFEASQIESISGDICNMPAGSANQRAFMGKTIGEDPSLQMDTSNMLSDKMDTQLIEEVALLGDMSSGKGLDGFEVLDIYTDNIIAVGTELKEGKENLEESKVGASVEIRPDVHADAAVPIDDADTSVANVYSETGGCTNLSYINVDQPLEYVENDKLGVSNKDGDIAVSLGHDDKDQTFSHICNEESKIDPTNSVGPDGNLKNFSLNGGDNPVCQEADQQRTVDMEITSLDHIVVGDSGDFQDAAFANDTEFLNVDDEMDEEDDDGMPGDESRLFENSGWSSRTRAVAKYLQNLFDNEAGHGRKILSMDNLLAGKTRKEASRMFFETLVLKTRDYIHVEQVNPFDNINIKPKAMLIKSDF